MKNLQMVPIALFVYKRLDHVKKTINSILRNNESASTDIYIFSDGAKSISDKNDIDEVRKYLSCVNGFKNITIINSNINLGLAKSIELGVTYVLERNSKVIVLEDDIELSPFALDYFNQNLEIYEKYENVMHISGYMYPVEIKDSPDIFFLPTASCWGWATWARAWKYYEKNPKVLTSKLLNNKELKYKFNMNGSYYFYDQVIYNLTCKMNTWAVFWYASIFFNGGLCLYPKFSMTRTHGNDGTGENCSQRNFFDTDLSFLRLSYEKAQLQINHTNNERVMNFFKINSSSLLVRLYLNIKIFILENMYAK